MTTPATVPMFAPDGTLGDVPYERMVDAKNAGAKPAVSVKAPDGQIGLVPADRLQEAVKAGGTIIPFEQQENQHAGIWHAIASDLSGILHPAGVSPYPGMGQEEKAAAAGQSYEQDQSRKAAGYSTPYRALAPVAQSVGVNVPGMEQSAAEGDVGGVIGHTAAPVATIAAVEALHQGGNAIIDALPSTERAGRTFQQVSGAVGKHTVPVTDGLSDAMLQYQKLVDAGGSRSLAVSKLLNRITDPTKGPLTYDEARLFQSNISRLSADEAQRLTPVMKRQVGQIAAELNGAVEQAAASGGKLGQFRAAMDEYRKAKQLETVKENSVDAAKSALKKAIPLAAGYYGAKKLIGME